MRVRVVANPSFRDMFDRRDRPYPRHIDAVRSERKLLETVSSMFQNPSNLLTILSGSNLTVSDWNPKSWLNGKIKLLVSSVGKN
jgi:hypothetical protein